MDRDNGTVLLMSEHAGRFQIYKQRIDADTPELLAGSPDNEFGAAFSPDAAWILYWSMAQGMSQAASRRLMRVPVSGGSPEEVLEAPVDRMIDLRLPFAAFQFMRHQPWGTKPAYFLCLGSRARSG